MNPPPGAGRSTPVAPADAFRPTLILGVAIGLAWAGAVAMATAPVVGVLGPDAEPAFTSWPWLFASHALAPAAATVLARRGLTLPAAVVLFAPALTAVGGLLLDLRPLAGSVLAARPELYVPTGLVGLAPGPGVWALVAGRLAAIAAGLCAARYLGARSTDRPGDDPRLRRVGAGVLLMSLVAVVGLVAVPMRSSDPFVVPTALVDAGSQGVTGGLLTVIAVLAAAAVTAGLRDRAMVRAGVFGLGAAILTVAAPPVLSGLFGPGLRPTWWPVAVLVVAGTLLAWSLSPGLGGAAGPRRVWTPPGRARSTSAAGAAAVCAGLAALAAAGTAVLVTDGGPVTDDTARFLIPTGIVLTVVGSLVAVGAVAATVRPLLSVVTVLGPVAGLGVLDVVLAPPVPEAVPGVGAHLTWPVVVGALLACGLSLLAGAREREEVDLTELTVDRRLVIVALVATPPLVAAYPADPATGVSGVYGATGVGFWSVALGLTAVLVAVWSAPRCRPVRGAAVLGGAAIVLVSRLVQVPMVGADPGWALWCGIAALVVICAGVSLAVRGGGDGAGGSG